jgi:phospholipid/cholesterol/gamma-HCH transport system permease protein
LANEAWLKSTIDGRRLVLAAAGNWTAAHAREIEPLVDAAVPDKTKYEQVDIDLARVEHIDTFGAWLVERMRRSATAAGLKTAIVGLDTRFKVLFDEIAASNKKDAWRPRDEMPIVVSLLHIGKSVLATRDDFVDMVNFLGVVTVAFARVLVKPWKFRFTSIVHQIDIVAFRAVPIIVLINFLIGAILAQQGIFHFRKFGAENFVVDMVGILTLREVGVLIVSIMVAGRSGSAFTAEIGTMKVNEEVDAMRTMGLDPVEVLVLPRMLAMIVALPLLTFYAGMMSLAGGMIMCMAALDISLVQFLTQLNEAITVGTFWVGMVKAPIFAFLIALVGTYEGLQVSGSVESVGKQTTKAVVESIFLVIVADAGFSILFSTLGI